MTMYKILLMDSDRHTALDGIVCADDGERWESLLQALNDLSSIGFEVETPIYHGARDWGRPTLAAFLLASKSATLPSDLKRRIKHTKASLAGAEDRLATLSSNSALRAERQWEKSHPPWKEEGGRIIDEMSPERRIRTGQRELVRKLRSELQELEQRLRMARRSENHDAP